jgi:Pyruvate/2-oxoacid:ferredoxin oxidoreductase delta subunit
LEGEGEVIQAQQVFMAIGADIGASWHLPSDNRQVLRLSHCCLSEGDIPIAYGGDLVNRARSVTDAIASGKQAAVAIDTYFKYGAEAIDSRMQACRVANGPGISMQAYLSERQIIRRAGWVAYDDINIDYFEPSQRKEPAVVSPGRSEQTFSDYRDNFTEPLAIQEASRCFNCGTCNACDNCSLFCPESAVLVDNTRRIDMDYCKGCGICVQECPRNAMTLESDDHDAGS